MDVHPVARQEDVFLAETVLLGRLHQVREQFRPVEELSDETGDLFPAESQALLPVLAVFSSVGNPFLEMSRQKWI